MTRSALDGISGLGPTRKARLIKEFGGVRAVKAATEADLLSLSWLPDTVAMNVYRHLHDPAA